ncbi:MAG TPA: FadR/GntR family transcriptional regulator [Nakamurella multipartita]|nr:FadR/GntR family transcriptional regulator [Nakamurella multipartita]
MRQSRTSAAADQLLGLVLDGTFPPGGALPSEAELAERFEVSRLTVREAIRSLASTNVIEVQQGKSSTINQPDRWSPLDPRLLQARGRVSGQPLLLPRKLIEARRTVEVGIAELAAGRRTDEHIGHLYLQIEAMRQAHQQGDVPRFVEADLAFHRTLFEAVDNVFLDAVFEPLAKVLRTLRTTTSSVSQIREHAIEWHGRILTAVVAADPEKSREAMRGHLIQTERDSEVYLTDEELLIGPPESAAG